jgi:hypothetical protein
VEPGAASVGTGHAPACANGVAASEEEEVGVSYSKGCQLLDFRPMARLEPGASMDWPLWLHPRRAGTLAFQYAWFYEPLKPVDGLKFRCGSS